MNVNKIIFGGETIIDLTETTVTAENLKKGIIAFDATGSKITGTLVVGRYTNQVFTATDTDESIYNGVGYKDDARLSSSGSVSGSAQAGSVTTGFIPFKNTDVIRMKGAKWLDESGGHYYLHLYNADKTCLTADGSYLYGGNFSATANMISQVSVTYDEATDITTFQIINPEGNTGGFRNAAKSASYFRINALGKGEDLIVTVNQEIE